MQSAKLEIAAELAAGEQLLWSGSPRQGVFLHGSQWILLVIVVPYAALGAIMQCVGLAIFFATGEPGALALCAAALFHTLFGLSLAGNGPILDARRHAHTFYGVTSKRIIIKRGVFRQRTTQFHLAMYPDVYCEERYGDAGDIFFGMTRMQAERSGLGAGHDQPCFERIDDVSRVYAVILKAQAAFSRERLAS